MLINNKITVSLNICAIRAAMHAINNTLLVLGIYLEKDQNEDI